MHQFLIETSWLIPIYGLIGALLTLPWSTGIIRNSGQRPAAYINIVTTLLAFVHGLFVFNAVWDQPPQQLVLPWFQAADFNLTFHVHLDSISVGAMETITLLSLLAQVYAIGYLEKDWALGRFYSLMGFFEAAMSGLVISDSLFLTYALLEMLTLSTYLLVGFWYAQPLVVTAARDAFLTKRVGDVLLLMGVVSLAVFSGSLNFEDIYRWSENSGLTPIAAGALGLALMAGPTGKCAQFPLHLWLDEAMEGPNPASILRNSVVVGCGAYVLIKLQPVLTMSPVTQVALLTLGTMTAIGASLVALAQIDIKRALAHSTSAFLGLVFIAVGMQWTDFALILLFTHAIAKALLFMSIGSIIATTSCQDITELGGLARKMPATTLAFSVGSLGLIGLFPLATYWAMLRGVETFWNDGAWIVGVILLVNVLTTINLVRVFRLVFLGEARPKTRRAPEVPWSMAVPMVTLSVATLLLPLVMQKLELLPDPSDVNYGAAGLLTLSGVVGVAIGSALKLEHAWMRSIQAPVRFLQDLLAYDFYVDKFYKITVVWAVSTLSQFTSWFDKYIVDGFVNLIGLASIFGGESLKYSASGRSQAYMLTILLGIALIGLFLSWSKITLTGWPVPGL
ncbi:NAD(P)H-quinone oxidoreductase subunit F [Alkalinema sp. FACHB-956]|uniref:NAD(P)H-quinone oxidoreductase subunit F n=1 Tax=Alkalinema sp. FACHB-956 TaxID=2692768 RepID=UPI001685445B|nr:NAD(P)H-quinone oxidoreductase subunit F [Alkalinema sp. FACHB-956]MBD2325743.1 NAD(P)H-quinone oxidoreductase subunit F [Alkalinema sp. FACHB-956]